MVTLITALISAGCAATETEKQAFHLMKKASASGMDHLNQAINLLENSSAITPLKKARQDYIALDQGIRAASIGVEEPELPAQYSTSEAEYWFRLYGREKEQNLALVQYLKDTAASIGSAATGGIPWKTLLGVGGPLSAAMGLLVNEIRKRKAVEKAAGVTAKTVKAKKILRDEEGAQDA